MITDKIKALFQFIEYLHSNIENFNQYNDLIKELEQLDKERNQLKPEQNYKDKLQYNKVQAELESKFKTLQDNTANLIKAKARELNVCNFNNEPNYNFNGIETEIRQLKKNFSNKDLPEIFKHKSQYLEYRSQTHGTFLSLQFFFDELDEIAKSLFDYFKDTEQNEFEAFETKTIQVNDVSEVVEQIQKGAKKVSFPIDYLLNPEKYQKLTPTLSQFIDNNLHEALSLNLSDYPAINNVLQKYKDKLRDAELESEFAEVKVFAESAVKDLKHKLQLHLRNNPNTIYKNHVAPYLWDVRLLFEYKDILKQLDGRNEPPQQNEKPKPEQDEVLSIQITHPKRTEIAKAIKDKYSSYKGKDFKILYEALLMLDLFPKKGKRSVFFRCLQNEGYNINNVQILEDKHFKKGQILKKTGKYHFTEDEKQRDEIIEYLKTIIETK